MAAKTLKKKKKPPELVAKLRKIAEVHEVFSLYPNELGQWATREFASHGVASLPVVTITAHPLFTLLAYGWVIAGLLYYRPWLTLAGVIACLGLFAA